MPPFGPTTFRYDSPHDFYGPGLDSNRSFGEQDTLLYGGQTVPNPTGKQAVGIGSFALGAGAAFGAGFIPLKNGRRVFDWYISAARHLEEYSPARILRTFQTSTMLSPFEAAAQQTRFWSPTNLRKLTSTASGQSWLQQTAAMMNQSFMPLEVFEQGFRFENGQLLLGRQGDKVLLQHAGVVLNPAGATPLLQESLARNVAGGTVKNLRLGLTTKIAHEVGGQETAEFISFIGGKTRGQVVKRALGGYGTALVERFNRLVESTSEIGILRPLRPLLRRLHTEPTSGLKALGKLGLKLGIGVPAVLGALDLVDWATGRLASHGAVKAYQGATKLTSALAEATGGHALREWQEEIAPGSTSLQKLLAFPVLGALGGAGLAFASKSIGQLEYQRAGRSLAEASLLAGAEKSFLLKELYGREISQDMVRTMTPDLIKQVEAQTQKTLSGLQGKIAKRIVAKQKLPGIAGKLYGLIGDVTPGKLKTLFGAGIGLLAVAPFIPGALVPEDRPAELDRIYSGEKLVPIRKGRWWEMGRQPYEGDKIDRFVPHWSVRYLTHARDKAIYGADVPAPYKFWKENFTYDLEREHYWDRPYPITGQAFEDVPLLGPLLSATIGKLIKPARMMHEEMYQNGPGGAESLPAAPLRAGTDRYPMPELGEGSAGLPDNPYGVDNAIGSQAYRMTEMIGLEGFRMGAIKQAITGQEGYHDQETLLQSANTMYGATRDYWEEELGGVVGLSELYRRLYPSKRPNPEWNAIPNQLAGIEWLPGPGERAPNLKVGDPYATVAQGEFRLPGPGYDEIHPELAGIDPNKWPLVAKLRVLGDVAPYSDKYRFMRANAYAAAASGNMSPEDMEEAREIFSQVDAKKKRKTFYEYKYTGQAKTEAAQLLAEANEAAKEDKPSWFGRTVGSYWETLAHSAETPLEYLTPISPGSKLVHVRSATEDYERTQAYGRTASFWQAPIRDFMMPFMNSTAHMLGRQSIPDEVQRMRDVEQYFDALEYIKNKRLERSARASGDEGAAQDFARQAGGTMTGINPYTMDFSQIMKALPRRERDYFDSFAKADLDDRAKIMAMVPQNEQAFYQARWQMNDVQDEKRAAAKGLMTQRQVEQAAQDQQALYERMHTEGMPRTKELWAEYLATAAHGENYPDWYRRRYLLAEQLGGRGIPGPDWVGFHPAVDLNDIKLKVVESMGDTIYDYDLWQEQARQVARRPWAGPAADELMGAMNSSVSREGVRDMVNSNLLANNIRGASVHVVPTTSGEVDIRMNFREDRSGEAANMLNKRGLN